MYLLPAAVLQFITIVMQQGHVEHVSDLRFKFLHAPLINAVEELDWVE